MTITTFGMALGVLLAPITLSQRPDQARKGQIRADPFCHRSGQEFMAQTILDVEYNLSKSRAEALGKQSYRSRVLWRIQCSLDTRACDAVHIDLDRLDRGEALHLWDLAIVKGMTVAAQSGNVVTLSWPPYRTLVLDFATRRLDYKESGSAGEGRGFGVFGACTAG